MMAIMTALDRARPEGRWATADRLDEARMGAEVVLRGN